MFEWNAQIFYYKIWNDTQVIIISDDSDPVPGLIFQGFWCVKTWSNIKIHETHANISIFTVCYSQKDAYWQGLSSAPV